MSPLLSAMSCEDDNEPQTCDHAAFAAREHHNKYNGGGGKDPPNC